MSGAATLSVSSRGVGVIRLNRPERSNALNIELKKDLLDLLSQVAVDDSIRAVVLTGVGKTFCVGQDLGELNQMLQEDPARAGETVERHYNPITLLLATMPKPVVAGVNGTCVGAGLGFALACDLQVWSATATLATAFVKVGLTTDSGLSATLARAVGHPRAAQLLLMAETFGIADAMQWGFAGEVVPAADVEARAIAVAEELATGPTRAFAATKRLLATSPFRNLQETLRAERDEQVTLGMTRDHAAAVAAFIVREAPVFSGG